MGWVTKMYYLELLRVSEGTLSRWFRLYLQSLAPTNQHWARVVDYGPFSLCVIHEEGLCPSSGDINRQMMNQKGYMCVCIFVWMSFHLKGVWPFRKVLILYLIYYTLSRICLLTQNILKFLVATGSKCSIPRISLGSIYQILWKTQPNYLIFIITLTSMR
jgi:hypothetical protein